MNIDTSKLSNKDDLVTVLVFFVFMGILAALFYLLLADDAFEAGFLFATAIFKAKDWVYRPIDNFLDKHWPFAGN